MAKLSVIVPAYNAETTLRTAVESILSQQVPGLEIIIVNDGSTDATDKICHALASQNQCIHVITQKNAGICAARNRGLEAASGEFLTFCDDDDLLWQGALKLLLHAVGGFVMLFLVNFFGSYLGISLEMSWLNAIVSGVLGVPGVVILLLFKYIL